MGLNEEEGNRDKVTSFNFHKYMLLYHGIKRRFIGHEGYTFSVLYHEIRNGIS